MHIERIFIKVKSCVILIACLWAGASAVAQQDLAVKAFVEAAGNGHAGDNTPFWMVANKFGLSSVDNSAYLRGSMDLQYKFGDNWRLEAGLDLVGAVGMDANFFVQQAYADIYYRWLGLSVGSRERSFPLLNKELSSGSLVVSDNARPIPQVRFGAFDYVQIWPRFGLKAELSFGWFTDGRFQKDFVDEHNYYSEKVLYHHKSFYMRIGLPEGRWVWEMGYRLDSQFGGKKTDNATGEVFDNGGGWKRYWHALIPQKGDSETTLGDQVQYEGNILGSEFLKLTHNNDLFSLSAYLENYFDDFSGMGKLNGFDGLWGIEYKGHKFKYIDNAVSEYYQSTHQSGPMHGMDFDDMALKTGGADDYYNNFFYTGWEHWGYSLGTPLSVSPVYNDNGSLRFYYNRVRAFHVAFSGDLSDEVSYVGRFNHSRTWGTPFMPTPEMKKSVSAAIEIDYSPAGLKSWHFRFGVGGDVSDVYGDNIGLSVAVRKCFDIVK